MIQPDLLLGRPVQPPDGGQNGVGSGADQRKRQETAMQTGHEEMKCSDSKTENKATYLRNCKRERTRLVVDYLWA